MNRIVKGHEARVMLAKAVTDGHDLIGLEVGYGGYRWRIGGASRVANAPFLQLNCIAYFASAKTYTTERLSPPRSEFIAYMDDSIRFYLNDFTPKTSSGAGQGSTHSRNGESTMSQNTTARLFSLATFNLGDEVKVGGKSALIVSLHGFYVNARYGRGYASDDPTSIPPTTAPSIDYTVLFKDGTVKLVKKAEMTLVDRYESIHDKLRIGTQAAFDSARAELDELKVDWVEAVASTPVAPVTAAAVFAACDIQVTVGGVKLTGPAAAVYAAAAKLA